MPANLRRIDHVSEHGIWTLFRHRPCTELAGYVIEMQGYTEKGGKPIVRKELPGAFVPMILVLGPGFTLHEPGCLAVRRNLDRSFIAGLHEVPALVGSGGESLCLQIDFTPLGARRFLGLDMQEIAGRIVDLEAILGAVATELEDRLAGTRDWEGRFALLERILCERIAKARPEHHLVSTALATIARSEGEIRIGGLAGQLGCSRKHLVTLFKREVGLSPRSVSRVLRFARAMTQLEKGDFRSLADLSAACGYADQAHFNRDFRRYTGENPSALLRRLLPDGTGLIA